MSERTKTFSLTVARLTLGGIALMHGLANTFGMFGGDGMSSFAAGYEARMGTSGALTAYVVALGQIGGGLCLLLGPYTRLAAALFASFLLARVLMFGQMSSFFLHKNGCEYSLALIALCLVVATHGPGAVYIEVKSKEGK